jgi:HSP20 family protein
MEGSGQRDEGGKPVASTEKHEVARRTPEVFERFFGPWSEWFRRPVPWWPFEGEDVLRVDEFQEGDTHVVRAELPGIDPAKDVEITVDNGMLHLRAERRLEEEKEGKTWRRRELRYGSFSRTLSLPEDVSENDIKASYKDGILEVRVPLPTGKAKKQATRIPVEQG